MRPSLEWYAGDSRNIQRFYNVEGSDERREHLSEFYKNWRTRLSQLKFDSMSQAGKIDYIVFRNALEHEIFGRLLLPENTTTPSTHR